MIDNAPIPDDNRLTTLKLLQRASKLRCPRCGQGKMFLGWFAMNDPCSQCGRKFDRAPGYLLGSIYFNYGVTSLLVVVIYFSMYFGTAVAGKNILFLVGALSLAFPIWFFRYARALWIAFDERFDPWPNEQEARELGVGKREMRVKIKTS